MGELHLEIIVDRLKREFNVEATVGKPQVAYKETLTRPADGEMKYAKQTGGRGQYGHAKIHVYPGEPGTGYIFENEIVGGAIPKEFIKPIDEGIKEARVARYVNEVFGELNVSMIESSHSFEPMLRFRLPVGGSWMPSLICSVTRQQATAWSNPVLALFVYNPPRLHLTYAQQHMLSAALDGVPTTR